MQDEPIVGTWRLEYFELQSPDGTISHPYGEKVHGYLVYSHEGIMSAGFMRADRGPQISDDLAEAETAPAWDAFMAYSGPYRVEGDRIVHDVEVSSLEVWIGTVQERWFKIDGDTLTLHTAPLSVGDSAPVRRLVWTRVTGGSAPR